MGSPGIDKAIVNLVKWATRDEWEPLQSEVYASHLDPVIDMLDVSDDDLAGLLGDSAHLLYIFIVEDFFTARFGENDEKNIVDDYLKRRGWRETVPARRYLEALKESSVSLYEIVDIDPGRSVTVRDLILGGDAVTIDEKLGSKSSALWDRWAARIVTVSGKKRFASGMLPFSHDASQQLLSVFDEMARNLKEELSKKSQEDDEVSPVTLSSLREMIVRGLRCAPVFTKFWTIDAVVRSRGPLPELRNSDNEKIVFCDVRFPIEGDESAVAAVLDGIEELERVEEDEQGEDGERHWVWLAPGSPFERMDRDREESPAAEPGDAIRRTSLGSCEIGSGALVLYVNSQERAERGRDLLASRLGDLVGHPLTSHRDVKSVLAEQAGLSEDEAWSPPEEAVQAVHAHLDEYYRRTLDEPIPMLEGKTPREAAASSEDRAQAIDWLKQLENTAHRRALQQGETPYDTAWIWRELGIEAPR